MICRHCNEDLSEDKFYFRNTEKGTRRNECKDCVRRIRGQRKKDWKRSDEPRACSRCRKVKAANEFNFKVRDLKSRQPLCRPCLHLLNTEDADKIRDKKLLKNYSITGSYYDKLYDYQGGKCAICGRDRPDKRRVKLQVDHSHENDKVRGLLCGSCNRALGLLGDDPERILSAYEYLIKPPSECIGE